MSELTLDAQALYLELLRGVKAMLRPSSRLVGITSGGAWLAERLQQDLALTAAPPSAPGRPAAAGYGVISSTMHRDDFSQRGLSRGGQTVLPFDVNGTDIILLDDVLYTGRTIRAVLNELFDFGRPAAVRLAVLVDRGGRELPIQPDFAAARVVLGPQQSLALQRDDAGRLRFLLEDLAVPAGKAA
jgi:pyrimidine operon attenuation protein/uracil phosphoribosyltransferase